MLVFLVGNPEARPRYFSLVTVPVPDIPTFFAKGSIFRSKWKHRQGLHLIFCRVGRFLEQYRTILAAMYPREVCGRAARSVPVVAARCTISVRRAVQRDNRVSISCCTSSALGAALSAALNRMMR